ncbi:MAG TPA: ATPase domain-containing protein [Terriglobales bacterium]|nr:ATPase domain-containing protein [Terriglobales bacterium]
MTVVNASNGDGQNLRVSSGIAGLDDVLNGGFPSNHLYLVEGDPGTGKTTMALQFLLEGVRLGESCLYVTLSESNRELEGVAESHGWTLHRIPVFEMTPQDEAINPEGEYTVFHPSDVELADTTASVLRQVDKVQPTRVVFDSLSELRMLAREPLRYRRQILGLKRYFAGRNCTVLLLDDRTAEGHDLQLQSIAHGVIMMQSLDREFGVKRRRLEVRKLRGSRFREGYHDYSIDTGGVTVFPRLVASEHAPGHNMAPVSSGIKELDQLVGGGLDSGTTTLLMGPAGCGKSSVAARYAAAAAERGESSAIFIFDETLTTYLHRSAGLGIEIAGPLRAGKISLHQVDPAEIAPGHFVHQVRKLVEDGRISVLVIDSLNGFLNAMPGETFLMLQLHELLSYLNQQGVTTIFTLAQHGLLGTAMDSPIDVSYLADSVLLFRFYELKGELRQALSVVKKRSGKHERTIRALTFDSGRLSLGPPLSDYRGIMTGVPQPATEDAGY